MGSIVCITKNQTDCEQETYKNTLANQLSFKHHNGAIIGPLENDDENLLSLISFGNNNHSRKHRNNVVEFCEYTPKAKWVETAKFHCHSPDTSGLHSSSFVSRAKNPNSWQKQKSESAKLVHGSSISTRSGLQTNALRSVHGCALDPEKRLIARLRPLPPLLPQSSSAPPTTPPRPPIRSSDCDPAMC
eukprot:CAMPEP_0172184464 /NCGR_PEP_ID=MMETSP1050-20130122/19595_1 /TAXON_ID=233186 /ORGANISM="Cryptomonas curvata, Strain CCAP979/52" /LENGTH=187 /DNA_ID=CAMNT_0012858275 /DNA_START=1 /DNA_END=567 /DNA_ORIENTATION=-